MTTPAPVPGSMADTEVVEPAASVICCVTGTLVFVMSPRGAVPVPSQPKRMLPNGARSTPDCVMVCA